MGEYIKREEAIAYPFAVLQNGRKAREKDDVHRSGNNFIRRSRQRTEGKILLHGCHYLSHTKEKNHEL